MYGAMDFVYSERVSSHVYKQQIQPNKQIKKKKKHTYFYLVDIIFRIPFHIWLSLLREDSLCHSAIRTTFLFTCFPDVHKRILKIQKAVLKLMKRQKKQKTEGTPFLL